MVLGAAADGLNACYGAVLVDGVLILSVFISLLVKNLLNRGSVLSQLFVQVLLQHLVIQCL